MKICGLMVFAVLAGGCASTTGIPRPAAFPNAPVPMGIRPAPRTPDRPLAGGALINAAASLQGVRYRLGGETPRDGFDCSGFVRYVYGQLRVALPRTVVEQYAFGSTVDARQLREGDLVFFQAVPAASPEVSAGPGPTHVGIAVGDGTFIHAPASGGVRFERLDTPYWQTRIVAVKRIL
jgi:cell wall-associated NlpC family hydrolase